MHDKTQLNDLYMTGLENCVPIEKFSQVVHFTYK